MLKWSHTKTLRCRSSYGAPVTLLVFSPVRQASFIRKGEIMRPHLNMWATELRFPQDSWLRASLRADLKALPLAVMMVLRDGMRTYELVVMLQRYQRCVFQRCVFQRCVYVVTPTLCVRRGELMVRWKMSVPSPPEGGCTTPWKCGLLFGTWRLPLSKLVVTFTWQCKSKLMSTHVSVSTVPSACSEWHVWRNRDCRSVGLENQPDATCAFRGQKKCPCTTHRRLFEVVFRHHLHRYFMLLFFGNF